jgi:hypothetical protein
MPLAFLLVGAAEGAGGRRGIDRLSIQALAFRDGLGSFRKLAVQIPQGQIEPKCVDEGPAAD